MKKLLPLLMVPVAIVATGCLNERTYVDPASASQPGAPANNLELKDGTLSGEFGPRQGFDGSAELTGSSDREWATSTTTITRTENGRGMGMMILWTNGVLLEQIEPGTYPIEYDPEGLSPGTLAANVCSGQADASSIDYDAPAEAGSVTMTRTPEGRVFDVHTETPVLDAMGTQTGDIDTADATFTLTN